MRIKKPFFLRSVVFACVCGALSALYFSPKFQAIMTLPDVVYIGAGNERVLYGIDEGDISVADDAVTVRASGDETLRSKGVAVSGDGEGATVATLSLFGVPVRTIELRVTGENSVIPCGNAVGIRIFLRGALVVGTSPVGEQKSPAQTAGISAGDIILEVNGAEVEDSGHLAELVNNASGDVSLTVERNGARRTVTVSPVKDEADSARKLGIWARDSTAGVGTMTFYDPASGVFAALGHAITDVDTGGILSIDTGELVTADVVGITQGTRGAPGELKGVFSQSGKLGVIDSNSECGIYGHATTQVTSALYPDGVGIGTRSDIRIGDAQVLSTVDSTGVKAYDCRIVRLTPQSSSTARGIVIEITDENLLEKTGGIVQGMSGSPIIQNGKLVGAVTHVFVNDPRKGYGMYIEWMMDAAWEASFSRAS